MKVLFVCNANIGRSQTAEAIFNKLSKKNHAVSAGLDISEVKGTTIGERAPGRVESLKELGIDISQNKPKQLTHEMARQAGRIICMCPEKPVPGFLDKGKLEAWNVEDGKGKSYEFVRRNRDQIKALVEKLVREIG
ncbi:MAG TPA: low molecular weight phosphatase family protein [archaeon]|nr:low molecular weight phosphatase family protein [archaeon]HLD80540.1 low molecular weight phosphatase family protein [archaeon]